MKYSFLKFESNNNQLIFDKIKENVKLNNNVLFWHYSNGESVIYNLTDADIDAIKDFFKKSNEFDTYFQKEGGVINGLE